MKTSPTTRILSLCCLLPLLMALFFPFLVMLITALKEPQEVFRQPPTWIPLRPTLSNFSEVFRRIPLAAYFANSLIIATGATLINLACALPAAYALSRLRFPGRSLFLYMVLITQMFSPIVLIISLYQIFSGAGMLEGSRIYIALILANASFSLAFSIWLLTGYLTAIPADIEEAALIDGCSRLGALWRVLLPIALPGLVTTVIFTFIAAWNEFVFALTFVADEDKRPLTVGIYSFVGRYNIEWQSLMAASLLATLPVVCLFIVIEKHLVKGLTAGAIR
ncbi:MAG: carbohydrate ABC transporter permease [Armatimonadetes bacterium]|nr:carbohydrate ABC transporter permease [Armatimonadota bacterium]